MKRRFFCFLLAVAAMLTLCVNTTFAEAQLYYVTDEVGLLTESENIELETMAEVASKQYGVGIYIVTVDDYQNYGTGDVFEVTYGIYHDYTMGEGENRDGIMLLLSMAERDWAMFCYGENCEYAFNSYGQAELENVFLDNFGDDDWYGGFKDYITECSVYLQKAADGKPVRQSPTFGIIIATCIALYIALMIVGGIWIFMSRVAKQKTANAYIAGNLNLTGQNDVFTYRTETRTKIESSSGGGSSSHSGGGGSGRSGKF
jgi:uncharacterized membrane protein YgcG